MAICQIGTASEIPFSLWWNDFSPGILRLLGQIHSGAGKHFTTQQWEGLPQTGASVRYSAWFTLPMRWKQLKMMFSDSEGDASVVRFVFSGPFGCCVDTSPLAVEGLKRKRLPKKKKNTLPWLHDVLHTQWRICQRAFLYSNAELSTVSKTSIQRLFPQRGRILPVLSAPPAVQLSALGAHFDFLLYARSRAPLLPRRRDMSRTPGASFLFLRCSNLFCPHGWRMVGGLVKWHGGSLGCDAAANVANVQVNIDVDQRSYWCWQVRTTALRSRRKWP